MCDYQHGRLKPECRADFISGHNSMRNDFNIEMDDEKSSESLVDISKETYIESLNDSFNIEIDDEKSTGTLVELLTTYGKVYEKSVSFERQLEEKTNELEAMKKKYDALVEDKQTADKVIDEQKNRLNDFEAAFKEKEMEIILLKVDLADSSKAQECLAVEAPGSPGDHLTCDDKERGGSDVAQEMELIKNEVSQMKELLLRQIENDTVAGLNETTTSVLPIPHNIDTPSILPTPHKIDTPGIPPISLDTPRSNITDVIVNMQDEKSDDEPESKECYLGQLQKIRQLKHDEFLKRKREPIEEASGENVEVSSNDDQLQQPEGDNYTWNPLNNTAKTSMTDLNNIYKGPLPKEAQWREGTTLIIGDSMIGGIEEGRLWNTKVRVKPGSTVEDMFFHITPYLRKHPSNIICHVGTNNARDDRSEVIMQKLIELKNYVVSKLPNCKLFFSSPITRKDDKDAAKVVEEVKEKMFLLETELVSNCNIGRDEISKKGLHLNNGGTRKLAGNFINILKGLNP